MVDCFVGYTHPIAKMDPHTMIEIRNYARPPKVAHDVMKSTYLLLGERKHELEVSVLYMNIHWVRSMS